MNKLTIFYVGEDGAGAKAQAEALRKNKQGAQLRDAMLFSGETEPCTAVVIMPDVPALKRKQIEAAYTQAGTKPDVPGYKAQQSATGGDRRIEHRGFGRWYVVRGEETVSGPHTKEQAARLAA